MIQGIFKAISSIFKVFTRSPFGIALITGMILAIMAMIFNPGESRSIFGAYLLVALLVLGMYTLYVLYLRRR